MKCEIITDYQQFQKLRNEWNSLLNQSQSNTAFLTWEWLDAWWQAYRTTENLFIILFRNYQEELVGIAPFVLNVINVNYFFKYKALYFWGLKLGVKESEYLDIITENGLEEAISGRVVQVLNERCKEWDILLYYEVPDESLSVGMIKRLAHSQRWLFKESSHGCSFIKLPETFGKYIKSLKPRMRTKVRSLPRRLQENHEVEYKVCITKEDLPVTLSSFIGLHQQRWEAVDQLGTFRDPQRQKFYEILSRYFVENNWLAIFSIKVDGVYRAHEFCFLYNNRLFVLQEGYDVEWERKGIGNVLRVFVLQYCIDNGLDEYDFLGGVTYHKNCWGVSIKNNVSITTGRRCLKTMLYLYTPIIVEWFKIIYRMVVPRKLVQLRINLANARKAKKARETVSGEKKKEKVVINRPVQ